MANPQFRAQSKVQQAIAMGRLPPITCMTMCVDCGKQANEYDHRDYNQPLDVEPVCHACNTKRGHALNYRPASIGVHFVTRGERALLHYIDQQARIHKRSRSAQIKVMLQRDAAQDASAKGG